MKQFSLRIGDAWVSDEILERDFTTKGFNTEEVIKRELTKDLDSYLEGQSPEYIEYMGVYGRSKGLDRLAMLFAHGDFRGNLQNRKWTHSDCGKDHLVQNWINSNDGKYHSLLFIACNPGTCEPTSKESLLLVPDRDIGGRILGLRTCYNLYVPKIGAVDSYTIDYELKKLKERIKIKEAQREGK